MCVKTLPSNSVQVGIYLIVLILNNVGLLLSVNPVCWAFNFIPFKIKPGFSLYQQNYIKEQIGKINKNTCLHWVDMDDSTAFRNLTSYVRFERWTDVGGQTIVSKPYKEKPLRAVITLSDQCFEQGDVLHEIVHALGFNHEQQRVDRDCYVWVSKGAQSYSDYQIDIHYAIPNIDRFPYDKQSIMHYRRSTGMRALSERFYEWEPLGYEEARLTELDLWKIQYRFCGRPHYCEVHPEHCRQMELKEGEMNCVKYAYQ